MLTVDAVTRRVEAMGELISASAYAEAARYERRLWCDVLEAISSGQWDTQELAAEALQTRRYKFRRIP